MSTMFFNHIRQSRNVSCVRQSDIILRGADQTKMEHLGEVDVQFKIGNIVFEHTFQIVNELGHSMILRHDFMTKEGLILDAGQQTLEIKGCIIPLQSHEHMSMLIRLNEEVSIQPNSAVYA